MPLYPLIYPWIINRLQDSADDINIVGGDIDFEITSVLNKQLQGYGLTYAQVQEGSYPNPAPNDAAWLNEAAGLYVAARLIVPLSTGGLTGPVTAEKLNPFDRKYGSGEGQDERDRWQQEADACMALISFVSTQAPGLTIVATGNNHQRLPRLYGNGYTGW